MQILIIEDEKKLADALAAILQNEHYFADVVYNGQDGLDYALADIYDVIVLDIMLPQKNGLQVLAELREKNIATPVLLLTAKAEIEDKIKGLDAGADDYLAKPFATGELLARIRAMSRRQGTTILTNEIKFEDLLLNKNTNQLISNNQQVKLGLKEVKMLELLLASAPQIVTKETFVTKIWGYDDETQYNNVEVYISFLRKKLSCIASRVRIRTVRGVGYFLEGTR